jgi:hypothetical protein
MLRKAPFILLVALSTALLAQPLLTQKKPAADKKPADKKK